MTLFELKEKMEMLQASIKADKDWLGENAANTAVETKALDEKQEHLQELEKRYGLLKAQHDEMEEAQRLSVAMKSGSGSGMDEDAVKAKAKAAFYKAALLGGDTRKAFEGLGAIPAQSADLGYGDNLLPTNLTTELIVEPFDDNSLRQVEPVSNVTGLEEPIFNFNIEDEDLEDVTDKDTATEIETSGGKITYGRHKTKIYVTVKDTVLHGTETDLVSTIEGGIRSGLATKEKINAFRATTDGKATGVSSDHMSFYLNGIKTVTGPNLVQAIINAWADLPDVFAGRATCIMRKQDYFAAVQQLANKNDTLWGKKPEDVLGVKVIFNDRAVKPIVGDFGFARQNYDIGTIYETDKDGLKGEYYFILTSWGDHRIRLKNAFRIAVETPAVEP